MSKILDLSNMLLSTVHFAPPWCVDKKTIKHLIFYF